MHIRGCPAWSINCLRCLKVVPRASYETHVTSPECEQRKQPDLFTSKDVRRVLAARRFKTDVRDRARSTPSWARWNTTQGYGRGTSGLEGTCGMLGSGDPDVLPSFRVPAETTAFWAAKLSEGRDGGGDSSNNGSNRSKAPGEKSAASCDPSAHTVPPRVARKSDQVAAFNDSQSAEEVWNAAPMDHFNSVETDGADEDSMPSACSEAIDGGVLPTDSANASLGADIIGLPLEDGSALAQINADCGDDSDPYALD